MKVTSIDLSAKKFCSHLPSVHPVSSRAQQTELILNPPTPHCDKRRLIYALATWCARNKSVAAGLDAHSWNGGNCDLVARMLRVMNVLLMQFVITRAIRGCLRTQSLLVKHRHIGPAMMYEPTRQKALVIL